MQDDGLPAVPKSGFPNNYLVMPALSRAFDHFWANDPGPGGVGLQDRYAEAWRQVATRFRGRQFNMGYDLLNEPWPGTGWQACANPEGCPPFDRDKLTPFSRRVYRQIRRADPRGIVWYEPNVLFNFGAESHHGAVGPQTGLSFHVYCLGRGDARRLARQTRSRATCAATRWRGCVGQRRRPGAAHRATRRCSPSSAPPTTSARSAGSSTRAEEHMVSWQEWHYCDCADPTTSGPGQHQSLVLDPASPPRGDNVNAREARHAGPLPAGRGRHAGALRLRRRLASAST